MRRHLFNLLAAASTLLCLALIAMWIRSHFAIDRLTWTRPNPSGQWVTRHIRFASTPPPVYIAIEKVTFTSGDGRFCVARAGWNIYDTMVAESRLVQHPFDARVLEPNGVTRDPGFAFGHPTKLTWVFPGFQPRWSWLGFFDKEANWTFVHSSAWRADLVRPRPRNRRAVLAAVAPVDHRPRPVATPLLARSLPTSAGIVR